MKLYVINAYRNGNRENHSYTLGVHSDRQEAIEIAEEHCDYRGGKYAVCVEEFQINKIDHDEMFTGNPEIYRAKSRIEEMNEI